MSTPLQLATTQDARAARWVEAGPDLLAALAAALDALTTLERFYLIDASQPIPPTLARQISQARGQATAATGWVVGR